MGFVLISVVCVPMWLCPELVLGPFSPNPDAIELAVYPMFAIALYMPIDAFGLVLMNSLLGAGASKLVMKISMVSQWVVFLPLAYVLIEYFNVGFLGVWLLQGSYRLLQTSAFAYHWRVGRWADIRI